MAGSNAGGPNDTGEDGSEEARTGEVAGEPRVEDILYEREYGGGSERGMSQQELFESSLSTLFFLWSSLVLNFV